MILIIFLVTTLMAIEARTIPADNCTIFLNYKTGDLQEPQPLLLIKTPTTYDFLYPRENTGALTLTPYKKFLLSCPGKRNKILGINGLNTSQITVNCLRNKTFTTGSLPFNFTTVRCRRLPVHEAHRTKSLCYRNSTLIKIGFNLPKFLTTYEVCRNDETFSTYFTKFTLSRNIGSFHAGFPRPGWKSEDFYDDYDMDYQYKFTTQLTTMETLLESNELANYYLNKSRNMFMAKGHMVAKADFVYGSAQGSTFWYLNSAPQWQTFNGGNWNSLEDSVRRFAGRKSVDLIVYTGVFGQMMLPDVNGNDTPIWLYARGRERGIPVPKYYWKVVYEPVSKRGAAFVGVNDPNADENSDVFLCDDISGEIKWLTWNSGDSRKGISYACSVDDLREKIEFIPSFEVDGVLN